MKISEYWAELETAAWADLEKYVGQPLPERMRRAARTIFFAGAHAALQELTGWDPDVEVQELTVDAIRLARLCRELGDACHETIELYAETLN